MSSRGSVDTNPPDVARQGCVSSARPSGGGIDGLAKVGEGRPLRERAALRQRRDFVGRKPPRARGAASTWQRGKCA